MKITTNTYAKILVKVAETEQNFPVIARAFWKFVQKNNDHRTLLKILDVFEEEYLKNKGKQIVNISSENEISPDELNYIKSWAEKKFGTEIIVKTNIDQACKSGIKITTKDYFMDLTPISKIKRLQQIIRN